MMGAPALMFSLTGNVRLDFDDFEEIEEHPMAAPILATFSQLFEGVMEVSPGDYENKVFSLDKLDPESLNTSTGNQIKLAANIISTLIDLLSDIGNEIVF